MERSMFTVSHGRLRMHDLLQEMGLEFVHWESPNELGRCSRLWLLEDIKHVLSKNTGTEAIEGIFVDSTESGIEVDVTPKSFSMMNRLRYLKIENGNLPKGLVYLPNSLRVLDWMGYPLKSLPSHFNPQKLLELSLCHSCIKHVWLGTEPLYNLKTIDLSHSVDLVSTPSFKGMAYLEVLFLEDCIRLYEVDPTIEALERLTVLNLKDCKSLLRLPSSVGGLKSLKDLNLSGCSKLDKLPDEVGHVACSEKLDVSGSSIRELPSSIGILKNIKESLAGCKAKSPKSWNMIFGPFQLLRKTSHILPGLLLRCLSGLHSLIQLNLSDCNLSEEAIPSEFGCLASLSRLDLSKNPFFHLPESISQLSKLKYLHLDWCSKLRMVPKFSRSRVHTDARKCISLDTLATLKEQCNSVLEGIFLNCFKMVGKESCKSIALSLLTRYLKFQHSDGMGHIFIGPGKEIPEWYNRQNVRSSVTVELHPGWFTKKFMGFATCVVFKPVKPLPSNQEWIIDCTLMVNGQHLGTLGLFCGELLSDHIWFNYLHRDKYNFKHEWRDIYLLSS